MIKAILASLLVMLMVFASGTAWAQQQLTEKEAKVLECLLTGAGTEDTIGFTFDACDRSIRDSKTKRRVRDLFVQMHYKKHGFEKTIDLLAKEGPKDRNTLEREGRIFTYRDYSFVGYARGLYATHPEVTAKMLVKTLRKHNAFTAKQLDFNTYLYYKLEAEEPISVNDIVGLLTQRWLASENVAYYYFNRYGAFQKPDNAEAIRRFVAALIANRHQPPFRDMLRNGESTAHMLNFLAVHADDATLKKLMQTEPSLPDTLGSAYMFDMVFAYYRLGIKPDLYLEADSSQCYLMLQHPDHQDYDDVANYCLPYMRDVSFYQSILEGRRQKGTPTFTGKVTDNAFHYSRHDMYLRHALETEGLSSVLEAIEPMDDLKRARILTYAAAYLDNRSSWQSLGTVLELLEPLTRDLGDKDLIRLLGYRTSSFNRSKHAAEQKPQSKKREYRSES